MHILGIAWQARQSAKDPFNSFAYYLALVAIFPLF
jgi:hypothetical protein